MAKVDTVGPLDADIVNDLLHSVGRFMGCPARRPAEE
jgi:hypothetical protein